MKPKVSDTQRVKTERQPDATWKAWALGASVEVYAKTEAKAIDMVEMILGDGEKDQDEDLEAPH